MAKRKTKTKTSRASAETEQRPSVIVGIGVCAGSFESLRALFANVGAGTGAAYIVAVRQEEGLDVPAVVEMVSRISPLDVAIAADGDLLQAERIYVGAQDELVTFEDGRLHTRETHAPAGHRGTLDTLLVSLAEHAHDRAVAVLLTGLANEGAAGITATKTFGGLSIAQANGDDRDAPGGSSPASVVDLVVPAEAIGTEIARYAEGLTLVESGGQEEVAPDLEAQVAQVATILRNVTGHDFHGYKRGTFIRRIQRRMLVLQINDIDAYVGHLREDREEAQHLFQDLLIGVTQFFRDPAEFEALERELPRLFEGKGPEDQFRVWVLGCATGEEAYSIAILLREHMSTLDRPPEVQIFATDLDARALNLARNGRYSSAIADHVRPDRLERWFVHEGDTYCVSKELRELCIFSPHNIVKDAPFSRIDIVSCRNLLIYLNTELQNRVIPIFHFALRPGGVLFLGSSENITRHQKLFAPVDRRNRVFRRQETASRIIPDFPLMPRVRTDGIDAVAPIVSGGARLSGNVNRQAQAIAERYAPAYVIVDAHGDVFHFSGRTGRYLEPTTGAANLNLVNLVHRDLRLDMRSALARAAAEGRRVEVPRLVVEQDDRSYGVTIVVEPISREEVTSLVVLFQDLGPVVEGIASAGDRLSSDEHVQRLESELRMTRDRLQATIEELESTNEELKSSNEEYQSINEELQSANEEMETSKEELQSVNEELQTVNGELSHRVQELARTNSDLKNLLESTQIATIFLDNELRVRNFTPAATDIFHLLESDVGRPLDHVVSRVAYPELQDDIRRVLKTLTPVERTVIDTAADRHYAARVLPYRSVDNYINGSVVTFTDLTDVYKAEAALRESEQRLAGELAALKTLQRISTELIPEQDIEAASMRLVEAALALMGSNAASLQILDAETGCLRLLASQGFHPESEAAWRLVEPGSAANGEGALASGARLVVADVEAGSPFSPEQVREYLRSNLRAVQSTPLVSRSGKMLGMISTHWREVHEPLERDFAVFDILARVAADLIERAAAESRLRELTRERENLLAGIPQLVWRAVDSGEWTWASPQWTAYTGQGTRQSLGHGWLDVVHGDDREAAEAAWARAGEEDGFDVEYRIRRADGGAYRWFRTRAAAVHDADGNIVEWLGTSTDIDDLRSLQLRQELLVSELQHRVRNMLTVIRSVFTRTVETGADLAEITSHFRGRLDALARTQVIVTRRADGHVDLEELIRDELASVGERDGPQLRIEGPTVMLESRAAESLGLAIHELTTNAIKYGALKGAEGTLDIHWTANIGESPTPQLSLIWDEQKVPMVSVKPIREGFGRELIEEALPHRLGAETRFEVRGGGIRCTIVLPLAAERSDMAQEAD